MSAASPDKFPPGPPQVVMIHGMWGRPDVWANFIPYFQARGFSVAAPLLRHHDAAPAAAPASLGRVSLIDYADDIESAIRTTDSLPILMGHSMGGSIAQILAARGLARALVLLAPGVSPGLGTLGPARIRIFRRLFARRRFWDRPQCLGEREAAYGLFHRLAPGERQARIAAMAPDSGRVLFEIALPWLGRHRACRVNLADIRCPVLIVSGAKDRIMPVAAIRRLARRYGPQARYIELKQHAHWLIGEPGWQEVAGLCAEWLAEMPTPGGFRDRAA